MEKSRGRSRRNVHGIRELKRHEGARNAAGNQQHAGDVLTALGKNLARSAYPPGTVAFAPEKQRLVFGTELFPVCPDELGRGGEVTQGGQKLLLVIRSGRAAESG